MTDTITRQPRRSQPRLCPHLGAHAPVPRAALLDLLEASSSTTVVAVLAPPGYGKTTLLAAWAERDPRSFAWLTIDHHDNDPAVLLRSIAATLDQIEPLDPALLETLRLPGRAAIDAVLPQLGSAVSGAALPVVLVLDDLHLLQSWDCLEVVAKLIDYLPPGSQLAIASRGEPPLPLARLRAEGRVLQIGPEDLAMDQHEAHALLADAGLHAGPGDVSELVRRTEGWPVALQFAALSSRPSRHGRGPKVALAGDDRFLNDYLQVVVLSRLPSRLVTFLTRCAVLDRMSGPLCDAALATTGSAELLEWLSRSNMLVIPLDRRRRWYRLHPLLRELLRAELEREEPDLARQLARRAAEWCERSNLRAAAIDYTMLAGDADRAARLVVDVALPTYVAGQLSTLQRWFDWFERHDLAGRHPSVALLGGWLNALAGHPAAAERWTDVVEGRSHDDIKADDVDPVDGPLALLKALLCRHGVEQMQTDAEVALSLAPAGSAFQATAHLLLGIAQLLAGDTDPAGQRLADAADIGEELGIDTAMVALAERSILAMSGGDWHEAEVLAERARTVARREWLEQYATSALLYAAMARLAIHRGDVPRARSDLAHAEGLVPKLTDALPHLAVQVRLELARGYLPLTDVAAARTVLGEVDSLLRRRPELGSLRCQAEELRAQLGAMRTGTIGASSLTAAEVRLLRLLGTHYSFREMGTQLSLSQHTVKSQAMSIYRKFGVSSRSEAIQHARDLGLLVQ